MKTLLITSVFLMGVWCPDISQIFAFSPTFISRWRGINCGTTSILPMPRGTSIGTSVNQAIKEPDFEYALIFDCDGVIIETEELHRLAYNAAFTEAGIEIDGKPVNWSVDYYDVLQNTVGGGKGKMNFHFRNTTGGLWPTSAHGKVPAPKTEAEKQQLVEELQELKIDLYKDMIKKNALPRPGVLKLMDEALADPSVGVGVCSASTKASVTRVLDVTLGEERRKKLNVCILGDDVKRLKPDPLIYITAAEKLNVNPTHCVVVEDSIIGLKAAKGAGMKCIITYTKSTEREDFYAYGCDAKVPDLGSRHVTLESIFGPMKEEGPDVEILRGVKDP